MGPSNQPFLGDEPISRVEWIDASELRANAYNPNAVFGPELRLLERSILRTGWVQPILISRDMEIIDGFHRWQLVLDSKRVRGKRGPMVPCVVLDVPRHEAMILTVRMNRAKGSHVAARMHLLVRELVDTHGLDLQELADEIGATVAEIELLYQRGVFDVKKIKDYRYSRAWIPVEEEP